VKSSSHVSTPMTVSSVATTASPKGTVVFAVSSESIMTPFEAYLTGHLPYHPRKRMLFSLLVSHPRSEVP